MSASADWSPAKPLPIEAVDPVNPIYLDRSTREVAEVNLLRRVAGRMAGALPLDAVLRELVDFATSVVNCDSCFIYVLEDKDLVLRASKNYHPNIVGRLRIKVGQGITGWVAQHREPVFVSRNSAADPRFKMFAELLEDSFEAFLSVPLINRGRLVGVINLQHRKARVYSDREIGLVSTLGFLVGAEIGRARLESERLELAAQLEVRKVVERAKGILQNDLRLSEEAAYQMLRRESQQRRKSMKDVAEAIILSHAIKQC
jgi:uroporphyrinogen-III synthase